LFLCCSYIYDSSFIADQFFSGLIAGSKLVDDDYGKDDYGGT
jgi:hypothetical protein